MCSTNNTSNTSNSPSISKYPGGASGTIGRYRSIYHYA